MASDVYLGNSEWAKRVTGNYQDLGLAVEGLNMAAGSIVYSNWIDNVEWVRNVIIFGQSDQQYDILVVRRDSSNVSDWGSTPITGKSATGGASNWQTSILDPTSGTGGSVLGKSVRFGIKNSSASPNTFGRLRIQLLGM